MAVGELYRYRHWLYSDLPTQYKQAMMVQESATTFRWFDHGCMNPGFVFVIGIDEDPNNQFERIELCQ